MVDQVSLQNDILEHFIRLKKNSRHILPIAEEPHVGRKYRKLFSTSQNFFFLSEDDKVTHDHDFPDMDPSTKRITLVRKPPIALNSQKERDQVEC